MAGFLGEDQIRRVKEATDLVDLIGAYAVVRRAGHDYKACCPIHQERTPSMHIYVDQQTYHCFGCGAHGDAISLVRDLENLDFVEAIEFLARRSGIQLEYSSGGDGAKRGERDRHIQVMEWSTAFYERCLWEDAAGAEGRAYLEGRHLDEATCRAFRLGWSPGHGRLLAAARRQGIDLQDLLALDLAVAYDGRQPSDRFYERLLFPICDRFGHPIAYSGRILPEGQRRAEAAGRGVGKYINSRDTPLYHKSSVVFNLHQARKAVRTAGRVLVMEGPTDVMAAHQAGMAECVAVLGTALTDEHARRLGATVGDQGAVILLFDGDEAGQSNSIKAVRTCLAAGVPTKAAVLPPGQDPAELLAAGGAEAFNAVLARPITDIDHLLHSLAPRPHQLDQRALITALDGVLEPLRGIADEDLLRLYADTVAAYSGIDRERVWRRLRQAPAAATSGREDPAAERPPEATIPEPTGEQDMVLHVLVRYPDLRGRVFDELGCEPCFFPQPWQELVAALLEDITTDADALSRLPVMERHPAVRAAFYRWRQRPLPVAVGDEADLNRMLQEAVLALRTRMAESRLRRAQDRLKEAQHRGDNDAARACLLEIVELQRFRQALAGHANEEADAEG